MRFLLLVAAVALAACAGTPPTAPGPAAGPTSGRPTFDDARAMFERRGVQPGQPLPPLSLVDLDGQRFDLAAFQRGRPLVLATVSLTCNVARRHQGAFADLARALGDRAAMLAVYTIDAHPAGDPCPYTGEEWVPDANVRDAVLVRQPTDLPARLLLARRYARDWLQGAGSIAVDTIDDASWRALGEAPNLGLVVAADGTVIARTGWFDAQALRAACERLLAGR